MESRDPPEKASVFLSIIVPKLDDPLRHWRKWQNQDRI
jgi:hypothetical protein